MLRRTCRANVDATGESPVFEKDSTTEGNIEDLEWLVQNRSKNQLSTLKIYKLINDHKEQLSVNQSQRANSQLLLGVAFSLWRAVFLSDIKQKRGSLMTDVEGFLLELIQNNAINYVQDRNNRSWTFRYYVQNAGDRLDKLHDRFINKKVSFALPGSTKGKKPKEWWEMHQASLDDAIKAFEASLRATAEKRAGAKSKPTTNSN